MMIDLYRFRCRFLIFNDQCLQSYLIIIQILKDPELQSGLATFLHAPHFFKQTADQLLDPGEGEGVPLAPLWVCETVSILPVLLCFYESSQDHLVHVLDDFFNDHSWLVVDLPI